MSFNEGDGIPMAEVPLAGYSDLSGSVRSRPGTNAATGGPARSDAGD